jgi:membrane fusion protein (multidrug efflux system)
MVHPMPITRTDTVRRLLLSGGALIGMALAGCNSEKAAAPPPQPQAQVSVVVLRPQPVAISAELPGRVAASLVAEVRPQVG